MIFMADEAWTNYMTAAMGSDNPADVARRLNVARSSVSRWAGGQVPGPQEVIRFARAYKRSPIQALVAAGYLKPSEAMRGEWDISMIPDDEILEEVKRRFNR